MFKEKGVKMSIRRQCGKHNNNNSNDDNMY